MDINKANAQFAHFEVKQLSKSHDRFLIIDRKELYHLGASLKDLGKRPVVSEVEPWFAFSKLDGNILEMMLEQIKKEVVT